MVILKAFKTVLLSTLSTLLCNGIVQLKHGAIIPHPANRIGKTSRADVRISFEKKTIAFFLPEEMQPNH